MNEWEIYLQIVIRTISQIWFLNFSLFFPLHNEVFKYNNLCCVLFFCAVWFSRFFDRLWGVRSRKVNSRKLSSATLTYWINCVSSISLRDSPAISPYPLVQLSLAKYQQSNLNLRQFTAGDLNGNFEWKMRKTWVKTNIGQFCKHVGNFASEVR